MANALDIDLLRAFLEVSETGSFTRAAQRLNRVQSAVSMQVKRLEEFVGHQLFKRNGRAVTLTDEGVVLLGHARRMISLNAEALADLQDSVMDGVVRLGASNVASYLLTGILSRSAEAYPRVQLEIRCGGSDDLLEALDRRDIDLALVTQHLGRRSGRLVRQEPLVWVQARGSRSHQKDPVPLALFGHGCKYRQAALRALDKCSRRWRIAYSSANPAGLQAAVEAGVAVGMAVQSTIAANMEVLGEVDGLPPLPPVRITLHQASRSPSLPVAHLAQNIVGNIPRGRRTPRK